jgi:hypothetical protein
MKMKKILSIFLAVFLIVSVTIIANPVSVSAAPWIADYNYRKKVTLSRASGAVTDYQMPLYVYKNDDYNIFERSYTFTTSMYDDANCAREAMVIKIGSTYFMYYMKNGDNQIWLATSADPDTGWAKYGAAAVMPKGAAGKWDSLYVTCPAVVFDNISTYYMFYEGADNVVPQSIGYATSTDGYTWTKRSVDDGIFKAGAGGQWDDYSVGTPAISKFGSTYYLSYHARKNGDPWDDLKIGMATSPNLVSGGTWARCSNNPILSFGAGGTWDADWVGSRSIIEYNGTYIMFYEGCATPGQLTDLIYI